MLIVIRRRGAGQAIVVMALAMVAICGMLALAIDAGRLYFQRRLMQDAVDSGALAGAQSLVGTVANPNEQPNSATYYALDDTFAVFSQNPANNDPNSSFYTAPINHTVTDSQGGYTVTAVAPTGYNNKQVQVTVSFNATATFVQVLGFQQIAILTTATAEAGTNAKTYALFAYTYGGSGNTIQNDQNGYAQVDDGFDGTDVCQASIQGLTVSNAKFHVPNPTQVSLNVNGDVTITGGYVSNTSNGLPHFVGLPSIGATDLPPASDGTNGVEFIFDQGGTFSATNADLPNDGSVFFVAPHFVPTGSTNIAFYITSTNGNNGVVWNEAFDASASNVPRFQVWGTVFDADPSGSMTLTGVALSRHNISATDSNASGQYA